jgi:hypothetical protein
MSEHTILCGSCQSPAKTVANPEPYDKVICPDCGREDRFDDVMGSVQKYVTDAVAKSLNDTLAKAVRSSKFLKVEKKYRPQSSYRWITTELGI